MNDGIDNRRESLPYATSFHAPVLCKAVLDGLVHRTDGLYVDGTLGGGGHSAAMLDVLGPKGRVIGIDRDEDAIETARSRIDSARFIALQGTFASMRSLLEAEGIHAVDGILLDLGVSSFQIDKAERGFSYQADGPLDMRMDRHSSMSAGDLLNVWSEVELRRVLFSLGEEPRARKLARAIIDARPLESTGQLADALRRVTPGREQIKTLSRVFQAIRIAVNGELDELEAALVEGLALLKPGGRLAVISYHSLEDRRVKRFFRFGNFSGEAKRDFYGNLLTPWHLLTRKPVEADPKEIAANPRARSARLRIAEKLEGKDPD